MISPSFQIFYTSQNAFYSHGIESIYNDKNKDVRNLENVIKLLSTVIPM